MHGLIRWIMYGTRVIYIMTKETAFERRKIMMHIEKKVEDRKVLVKRLGELLGIKPKYLFTPSYAFEIGKYTVTKEGALEVEDPDDKILNTLCEEGLIEKVDTSDQEPSQEPESEVENYEVCIALPYKNHTGATLRNLVNLLYQRSGLINKATGAAFSVRKELIESLAEEKDDLTKERFFECIGEFPDGIKGLNFTDTEIQFLGFPELQDSEILETHIDLASLMNQQALTQKRIQAKEVTEENEKYAFRIWLLRIGMKGEEFKTTRKILLKNLSGNAAFRTDEEAKAFAEKQKAKRDAAKEAKA